MKRSGPLARRTPLKRTGSLSRGAGLQRSGSAIKRKRRGVAPTLREQVILRDQGCVAQSLVPGLACWGRIDPHHVLRRSQGGADSLDNLVALCRAHHDYVHAQPAWASRHGLLKVKERGLSDGTA